jgi:hypothetical protein
MTPAMLICFSLNLLKEDTEPRFTNDPKLASHLKHIKDPKPTSDPVLKKHINLVHMH